MKLFGQIGRFGVVGLLATAVHVAVYLSLVYGFAIAPFWANLPAFSMGVLISYFGNLVWTFNMRDAGVTRLPHFILVAVIGLIANQTIVELVTEVLGQPPWLAIAVVVVVVPPMTYLVARWWIFTSAERN